MLNGKGLRKKSRHGGWQRICIIKSPTDIGKWVQIFWFRSLYVFLQQPRLGFEQSGLPASERPVAEKYRAEEII